MSSPVFLVPFHAALTAAPQATDASSAAPATPAGAPPQAGTESMFGGMLIPLVLCMVVFYFFMIGPERKQRKKREAMLASLQKGAKVMTTGGMYGTVTQLQDGVVTLQIADGVRVRYALSAVQSVIEDESSESEKDAAKA
jgi:preprotein translocase subunit YajC